MSWVKLKSFLGTRGESSSMEHLGDLQSKLNVNEEYTKALRTKSFTDIWDKVHGEKDKNTHYISDYLLEPRQDILTDMLKTTDLHHLLIDFFNGNLEASRICGRLLQTIDTTRSDYTIIQKIIKLNTPNSSDYTDDQCRFIFSTFASFKKLNNPLSSSEPLQLNKLRYQCGLILDRLTISRKRVARKVKLISLCENIWKVFLIVACGALAAATLVLGVHGFIGIVAAPVVLTICNALMGLLKRRRSFKFIKLETRRSGLRRLEAQLDVAAKGVFILNQDFGTMSRLVMRLHDEIEHIKSIAGLCLRNQKRQMLKEVVREIRVHESCFLEQLEELEEHVYLCFLTINRARRHVIQEILVQRSHQLS